MGLEGEFLCRPQMSVPPVALIKAEVVITATPLPRHYRTVAP